MQPRGYRITDDSDDKLPPGMVTADEICWTLKPIEHPIQPPTCRDTAVHPVADYRDLVIRDLADSDASLAADVAALSDELAVTREMRNEALRQLQLTTAHLETARATIRAMRATHSRTLSQGLAA